MANALIVIVKESMDELKAALKKTPLHHCPRIKMLIEIKKSDIALSKTALALLVGANHNSIQTWRSKYVENGLSGLLSDGRIGFKPAMLSPSVHKKIALKLQSSAPTFTSYKQLHQWVNSLSKKEVKYNSLRHYVKRHFGATLKVPRKSHIKKDRNAVIAFKKTSTNNVSNK